MKFVGFAKGPQIKAFWHFWRLPNGYEVYVEASDSYRVKAVALTKEEFENRIKSSVENEYWGVIDIETNKLVAFCMNAVTDESCEYRTMKAIPKYQKLYAYYGLIYDMNRYYLEERKVKYVNDGARSITNHSNIQPFLIDKFKFRKAYCHLSVKYKWWLKIVVKSIYPFRKMVSIRQVKALLYMEAMACDWLLYNKVSCSLFPIEQGLISTTTV